MNSARIKALRETDVKPVKNIGSHFLTTTKYPVLYQRITKCGCTYLRNLMWYLEHGAVPTGKLGQRGSEQIEMTAAHLSDDQVTGSAVKFVVIRHPIARFMSLYFDKIVSHTPGQVSGVGKALVKKAKIDLEAGQDIERHRENCDKALNYIAHDLRTKSYGKINWHWKPQLFRMSQLRPYEFTTLHLEGLNWQLPQVLGDVVPDIKEVMQVVDTRNASQKLVSADDILTGPMRLKIRRIYNTDYRMWKEVRNFWLDSKP